MLNKEIIKQTIIEKLQDRSSDPSSPKDGKVNIILGRQ
ncbi:hypothetical protein EZN00_01417 [Clostridium tyrobutyricum]|nr:hypothetical protein EZN00_01417 [Clostridium tyrobutyricum]